MGLSEDAPLSDEEAARLWESLCPRFRSGLLCALMMYVRALCIGGRVNPLTVPCLENDAIMGAGPGLVPLGLMQGCEGYTPIFRLTRRGFDLALHALRAGRDSLIPEALALSGTSREGKAGPS